MPGEFDWVDIQEIEVIKQLNELAVWLAPADGGLEEICDLN